jgi:hypothetical protein
MGKDGMGKRRETERSQRKQDSEWSAARNESIAKKECAPFGVSPIDLVGPFIGLGVRDV